MTGDPAAGTDPWAGLARAVADRKRQYLTALIVPFAADKPEERAKVTARRRGYLKGRHFGHDGKRPTATPEEIKAASDRVGAHTAVWYDMPAARATPDWEPVADDASAAIARLRVTPVDRADPTRYKLPDWFAANLPVLTDKVHIAKLIPALERIGVDIVGDIRAVFAASGLFTEDLINRLITAIKDPATSGTPSNGDPPTYAAIWGFLPQALAQEVYVAVRDKGGFDLMDEGQFRVTGGYATEDLSPGASAAVMLLVELSRCKTKTVTDAIADLADRLLPYHPLKQMLVQRIRVQPYEYPVIRYRRGLPLPAGWVWPPWDDAGVYWWRAIIWRHVIEHLLTEKDTADFHASGLLRFVYANKLFTDKADKRVPEYVTTAIKLGLLNFKYWWDQSAEGRSGGYDWESGKEVEMTFWSENHQIQFASSELLAGQLWPDETFAYGVGDGPRTGRQHAEWAKARLNDWLSWRLSYGFGEWRAPGYYNEDFPPLFNLVDMCEDEVIRRKAAILLDRLIFELARFTCNGSFGSSAGRSYWEHKAYGWGQSVGDTIEILFGTRGDFQGVENSAVALATSSYEPPHALLAIGRDRVVLDRTVPFTDRSRIAPSYDEAVKAGIGADERHIAFWWGAGAYFLEETLETTKEVTEKYGNLRNTPPLNTPYLLGDSEFHSVLHNMLVVTAGSLISGTGVALSALLPFPANLLAVGVGAAGVELTLKGLWHTLKDVVAIVGKVIHEIGEFLGLAEDEDEPRIPESALQEALEALLVQFNKGSALTRANLMSHSIGDAMLSSVVNHRVGEFSFQKHTWQATLDCDACVWTTAPFTQDAGSVPRAWLEMFKDLAQLRPVRALGNIGLSLEPVHDAVGDMLGHNGPNYWTGDVSLPFIVAHERALIEAYNLSNLDRVVTDAKTHAWFPKEQFDETDQADAHDGTWTFGRKGEGYVALFSARKAGWTTEGVWKDKELVAEGGANIWICHIGNAEMFAPFRPPLSPAEARDMQDPSYLARQGFRAFKDETLAARLNISGVGSTNQLQASFDIPRAKAPQGRTPRLELFFDDRVGKFAGDNLAIDEFPQYENRYVGTVPWGATRYTIKHPPTGLELTHDLVKAERPFTTQPTAVAGVPAPPRRLHDSLTPVRRSRPAAFRLR